jgi:hypothetical protein
MMTDSTDPQTTTGDTVKWVCIFNERGIPVCWRSTDGQTRDGMDPPPMKDWMHEDGGIGRGQLN